MVLLGEDSSHGSGATLEAKVAIVERLIEECHFSAVFFESQAYDFLDLELALAARTATPEQLADAIGGLWSTTREIDPLVSFLYQAAAWLARQAGTDLVEIPGAHMAYLTEPAAVAERLRPLLQDHS